MFIFGTLGQECLNVHCFVVVKCAGDRQTFARPKCAKEIFAPSLHLKSYTALPPTFQGSKADFHFFCSSKMQPLKLTKTGTIWSSSIALSLLLLIALSKYIFIS